MNDDANLQTNAAIHVVGGGLAGLVAAATVARCGRSVVVHETRNRLGGRATTDDRDGFLFNQGPHAFYRGGPGERILTELGVTPRGVAPANSEAMMTRDGKLFFAPGTTGTLARTRLLGWRDKAAIASFLARLPKIDPAPLAAVTAADWIDDVAPRAAVNELLRSLVRLTSYADAPDVLSADVAATQLQLALGPGVLYLDGGWQQLVEQLASTPAVMISRGRPVTDLDALGARAVIVCAGSPAATAKLVGVDMPAGPEATVASLDIGLSCAPRHTFVLGVDEPMYLSEHGGAAGMSSSGHTSISAAEYHRVGASPAPHGETKDRLRRFAEHAVDPSTVVTERFLHRMVTCAGLPTAASGGLSGRVPVVVAERPGVFVAGDWVGSEGHLADAVIASADAAARVAVAHLDRVPSLR